MKLDMKKMIMNVPLIDLNTNKDNEIHVLLEKFNICGSIKIKTVYWIIEDAIQKWLLTKDKTILEASSGNTAIALAYLGNAYGFKVDIILPKSTAPCKVKLIGSYGANVIKVEWITDDCIPVRDQIFTDNPDKYFLTDQFTNYNNMEAHYNLTAPYIVEKLGKIDFFAAGLGTSGTLIGVAKYLKEINPNIKILAINPSNKVEWLRNFKTTQMDIPFYTEYKYLIDEVIDVNFEKDSVNGIRNMIWEWYFVWISSGAIYSGLQKYLKGKKWLKGVFIAPDGWDFYLDSIMKHLNTDMFVGCK